MSAAATPALLAVRGLEKRFGGVVATDRVDLDVASGEIHALIGPNGAGKTTLFNLISGLFAPNEGTVKLRDREIQALPAQEICRRGLARSFQITSLFKTLSVGENIRLSVQARHPRHFNVWRPAASYQDVNSETAELIRFLGLEGIEDIQGGDLSYGGQRLVDLGIALGSKPEVLLLD
jgi:ABC-type branched-subunit amino acid transport system ATPase component